MAYLKIALRDLVRIKRQMSDLGLRDQKSDRLLPMFECRPILVNTASPDEKGYLVLANGRLVAVLVRLASTGREQDKEKLSGWHMEVGFGPCAVTVSPLFNTLGNAVAWMRKQLDT